jgi:hypothetical protein
MYEFIPDDGEAILVSGEVLNLGVTRLQRRGKLLAKRQGPIFHAIVNGKHGVARAIPGSSPSLASSCGTSLARMASCGQ